MLKTDLIGVQFNQVLNRKETLRWWTFSRSADGGMLLKGRLRTDRHQFDEVVLVHETLVDPNNEMSERLKLDEDDGCNMEG